MKIDEIDVGARIRAQRKSRKLSLNRLASMTGIAASNLSSIELNKTSPTLGTLARIASAFNMKVSIFVEEIFYDKAAVCIPELLDINQTSSQKVVHSSLTSKLRMNSIEVTHLIFEPGSVLNTQEGFERFLYCIDGALEARIDVDLFELKKGMGIYLMPESNATFKNTSTADSKILMTVHKKPSLNNDRV
ncbi:MAG: helix-turn-helix domain-containing protein [Desulfomonilaceae bacterium]